MKERKVIIKTGLNLENTYASLPEIFFTRQSPSHVPSPKLAILNYPLITSLGLNAQVLQSADGVDILSGNKTPEGLYLLLKHMQDINSGILPCWVMEELFF